MLVLTRRPKEIVKIGDDIEIEILGVKGNQVRLGFKAPFDIEIHRLEIYEKLKSEHPPGKLKRRMTYEL